MAVHQPSPAGVAEAGVGTVGEQPADAGGAAVACRCVQRQPSPFGVGLVDRGSGLNEPVDDVQPLVIGGEHQRPDPALQREPVQRRAGDVAGCGGHLQAVDPGPGGDQDIHHLGHAEHRRVLQCGAVGHAVVGHAAGVGCGDGLDVGSGVDEHSGDFGVAVAGGGDQGGSESPGRPSAGAPATISAPASASCAEDRMTWSEITLILATASGSPRWAACRGLWPGAGAGLQVESGRQTGPARAASCAGRCPGRAGRPCPRSGRAGSGGRGGTA